MASFPVGLASAGIITGVSPTAGRAAARRHGTKQPTAAMKASARTCNVVNYDSRCPLGTGVVSSNQRRRQHDRRHCIRTMTSTPGAVSPTSTVIVEADVESDSVVATDKVNPDPSPPSRTVVEGFHPYKSKS